jgi:hypothetical protein
MRPNKGYQLIDFMSKARCRVPGTDGWEREPWERDVVQRSGAETDAQGKDFCATADRD